MKKSVFMRSITSGLPHSLTKPMRERPLGFRPTKPLRLVLGQYVLLRGYYDFRYCHRDGMGSHPDLLLLIVETRQNREQEAINVLMLSLKYALTD